MCPVARHPTHVPQEGCQYVNSGILHAWKKPQSWPRDMEPCEERRGGPEALPTNAHRDCATSQPDLRQPQTTSVSTPRLPTPDTGAPLRLGAQRLLHCESNGRAEPPFPRDPRHRRSLIRRSFAQSHLLRLDHGPLGAFASRSGVRRRSRSKTPALCMRPQSRMRLEVWPADAAERCGLPRNPCAADLT